MDVLARVTVLDLEGRPQDIDLGLEAYDLRENAWRGIEDILRAFRISPKTSRDRGRHEISFKLKEAAFLQLFGATAFFRLVSHSRAAGDIAAHVILASKSVSNDADRFEVDFATIVFLGKEHGFQTVQAKDSIFCSGVSLASDVILATAQRRFYANPYEVAEVAADRDRMRDQIGRLEAANAALEHSLAQCQAERSKLIQENVGLGEHLASANHDLGACAGERDRLRAQSEELRTTNAALERALAQCQAEHAKLLQEHAGVEERLAAADRDLVACAAERDRLRAQSEELRTTNGALERALTQCQAEHTKLLQEHASVEEKLAAADRDLVACAAGRDHLTKQLGACANDREAAAAQVEMLRRQLVAATNELRQIQEGRQKAEADLSTCRERIETLERRIAECAAALEACGRTKAELQERAAAAERERDTLGDRASSLEEERRLLVAELEELRHRASDEQGYVERLRIQLVTEKATATAATQKLDLIRTQQRSEIATEALFKTLARSLGDATREFATQNIPYRIGRVDFKLKTFVGADGGKVFLPDAAHAADNPALSEVSVELVPDEAMAPGKPAITVPDVLGLTETAVIRVLASLSLKAEKAVETVTNQPEKHGRALRQIPKAGAPATKGDTILVVYGAEKGDRDEQ
jgi:predicted  nucleic acid-binding Zn-ribbon protein